MTFTRKCAFFKIEIIFFSMHSIRLSMVGVAQCHCLCRSFLDPIGPTWAPVLTRLRCNWIEVPSRNRYDH